VESKLLEFNIIDAALDMEGEGQSIVDVLIVGAVGVVVPHIDEESFLIVQMLIEL